MVKTCCIKFCKSESYRGCGISFHNFPKNEEMKKKWHDVVPTSQRITKNSVVCSLHFKRDDFITFRAHSRQILKAEAIPSVFSSIQVEVTEPPYSPVESCSSYTSQDSYVPEENKLLTNEICTVKKEVAVQTDMKCCNSAEEMLKRKVKILSQKLKRRDTRLKKLKSMLKDRAVIIYVCK